MSTKPRHLTIIAAVRENVLAPEGVEFLARDDVEAGCDRTNSQPAWPSAFRWRVSGQRLRKAAESRCLIRWPGYDRRLTKPQLNTTNLVFL
jgi:hypothetical protein